MPQTAPHSPRDSGATPPRADAGAAAPETAAQRENKLAAVTRVLDSLRPDGLMTEPEGLALLAALRVPVPRHRVMREGGDLDPAWLASLPGGRVVLKIVSREIAHKSDVGGVVIVPNRPAAIREGVESLCHRFGAVATGVLVEEFIPYESGAGGELLIGFRWTDDFGPIVSVGTGGLYAEFLARRTGAGEGVAMLSPGLEPPALARELLEAAPVITLATGSLRGEKPRAPLGDLVLIVQRFLELAARFGGGRLAEFEVNPLVAAGGRFVALDALGRLIDRPRPAPAARPVEKLARLFTPRSVGVIGVSEKMNPGHIIVRNLLREKFDPGQITIVKPGCAAIDGCRCVPDLASLPGPVDLLVLAIAAHQVPDAVEEIVHGQRAESLIVIPGGLEEKEGTAPLIQRIREALDAARRTEWQGPVICGGNSLGVRSLPGRIDTLFIPEEKLPLAGSPSPVALISNSGAFAVARAGKLGGLNPRYIVTAGNQMDVTLGDYLAFLGGDPEVRVFAVYIEGLRALDGLRLVQAAREITATGRTVILYRAGRTSAGRAASASHTAAIAGDYAITRALARQAGVLVAESHDEFEDLVRLATRLGSRRGEGTRLGALTNAGFECVSLADSLGPFSLASLGDGTRAALREVLERARIASIVDVHNPLDLTPMADDAAYEEAARLVIEDEGVDLAVIGCVPLTAALKTSAREIDDPNGLATRLIRLHAATRKPWVMVIDGGPLFDPLVQRLEAAGIVTFRTADRALKALARYYSSAGR